MRIIRNGLLMGVLGCCLWACTKPSNIGADIFPPGDFINAEFTDTISVSSHTERDDSLQTSHMSRYLLGSNDESTFGKTYAGIYSQLLLPTGNVDLGDGLQLDSAVVSLVVDGVYGDFTQPQDFNVYRVTEDMDPEKVYYNYSSFNVEPAPIGNKQNITPVTDSTIRIRLDQSFGQELLDLSGTSTMADNEAFKDYLKGIYIAPDTTNGYGNGITYVNMATGFSTITLYYSNAEEDSLFFRFVIDNNASIVNHFNHNYSGTKIEQQLQTSGADSIGYLQAMAGLRVRVNFPHIRDWEDVSVNKAELVINSLNTHTTYLPPSLLKPRLIKSGGSQEALIDEGFESLTNAYAVGGTQTKVTINGQQYYQYRINLLRYIQLLIDGKITKDELAVKIVPASIVASRTTIAGGTYPDPDLRMKLNLFYTKID